MFNQIAPVGVDLITEYDKHDEFIPWQKGTIINLKVVEYLKKLGYFYDDKTNQWYKLTFDGYYIPSSESELKHDMYSLLRSKKETDNIPSSIVTSIVSELSSTSNNTALMKRFNDFCMLHDEYDTFEIDNFMPCINGIFDKRNGNLLGHCGLIFNPISDFHNFNYEKLSDDDIKYSPFEDIYKEIISDDATRYYYYAWLGRIIFSNDVLPTILIIYGRGGTGKTSLSLAIRELLGHSRVSSVGFNQITDKFAFSNLIGKRLNVMDEVETSSEDKRIERTTVLKQITGGDAVKVEAKYKDAYFTDLRTNVLIIGNSEPDLNVSDTGLIRRVSVITCNNKIDNPHLHEEITSNDALNWLWNKVYSVWLETRDKDLNDIMSLEMIDNKNVYLHSGNDGLSAWVMYYCGSLEDKDVQKRFNKQYTNDLRKSYEDFCLDYGYEKPISSKKFGQKLALDYNMVLSRGSRTTFLEVKKRKK